MFIYRPSKGNMWGHALRPRDPLKAKPAVNRFLETFFETSDPQWDAYGQSTLSLSWRTSVLPQVEWAAEFLTLAGRRSQQVTFLLIRTPALGSRISFPLGLPFPLSVTEPASYEFLRRFAAEAPFKMNAKNFKVGIIHKNGKLASRKPDAGIAARLAGAVEQG